LGECEDFVNKTLRENVIKQTWTSAFNLMESKNKKAKEVARV